MKLFFKIAVIVFSQHLLSQSISQTTIDSLERLLPTTKEDSSKVNLLNTIASEYQYTNGEKALSYSHKALTLSKKIGWEEGIARTQLTIGSNQYSLLDYENALKSFDHALLLTNNNKTKSNIFKSIALVYSSQSNYTKSIEYSFKALNISELYNDKSLNAKLYTNIGTDYSRLNNFTKAIEYYQKALKIHEELNNKKGISLVCQNIGNFYYLQKQEDKAIEYINRSMAINNEVGNTRGKVFNLESLSGVYLQKSDLKNALETGTKALELAETIKDEESVSFIAILLGDIYLETAKVEETQSLKTDYLAKAEDNYNKGLEIHKKMDVLQELSVDYEKLSIVQNLTGNFKTALENYRTSVKFKDSVFNSENKETIKNLEDRREIELRDKQIELNTLTIETNRKQKLYLTGGLILLAIIGSLLLYQNRMRRRNNLNLQSLNLELDQSNKIKTRFLSILNHDLRSPVNNLLHFLNLIKDNPEMLDDVDKKRLISKNADSAEHLLSNMDDILLWSKGQMTNFGPKPKKVSVTDLFEYINNQFSSFESITFNFENPENISLFNDEDYLKTIMRNLTSNAIKILNNTSEATIIWKAWHENEHNYIAISDNGPGSSQEKFTPLFDDKEISGVKTGLGLHLIRDLSKAINCKITVNSEISKGTVFTLEL